MPFKNTSLISLFSLLPLPVQTMARVWDALFSEGPKILYRVALTLLKDCAPDMLAADNTGDLISAIKACCHDCHDRDALMKVRAGALVLCIGIRSHQDHGAEWQW